MLDISSDKLLWLIPVCVLGGLFFGLIQYYNRPVGNKLTSRLLAGSRSLAAAILLFLLLGPLIETIFETREKPVIPILLDDSESVGLSSELKSTSLVDSCEVLKHKLEGAGYEVHYYNLSGKVDSLNPVFLEPESALQEKLAQIDQRYEFTNVPLALFISDGITNKGVQPDGMGTEFPMYTVFAGDSLPKSDLAVGRIKYNRFGFVGNKVPIVVEVLFKEIKEASLQVKLVGTDGSVTEKKVSRTNTLGVEKVEFLVELKEEGQIGYDVRLERLKDEVTYANNTKRVFIRAQKNRKKIILLAAAPHPDIKLFRRALSPYEEYEITVAYENEPLEEGNLTDDVSLIICHQVPSKKSDMRVVNFLKKFSAPKLFVVGNQTDLLTFNSIQDQFQISGRNGSLDDVQVSVSPNFSTFHVNTEELGFLSYSPPIKVPFGEYKVSSLDVLANQQVGTVVTDNPMIALGLQASNKSGFIVGEGWWRLSLFEFLDKEEQTGLNDLIAKVISVLIESNDKKKFVCEPSKSSFNRVEGATFQVELYNELFEPVYDEKVNLQVASETGETEEFELSLVEGKNYYGLPELEEGLYKYKGAVNYSGKKYRTAGEFVVVDKKLETSDLLGRPQVLAKIANSSNGQFYQSLEASAIAEDILKLESPEVIHFSEEYVDLIELKWLFAVVVALLSIEWVSRKWNNQY